MARLVAYQREVKLLKYATASLHLCHQEAVTQRQVQVVAGGLVYMSMSLPGQCRLEILRFLCLIPLARMGFRLPVRPLVTCSDATEMCGGSV